ncbi:MAG: DUF1559 domain-containing protein [Phycisphaerae bacterium]|nr:DUF1559 domain-containing protein [Phycisphaerae bacterium]
MFSRRSAFTLVELMVTLAIMITLIAILIPSMARAKESARIAMCSANQHQLAVAWRTYAGNNRQDLVGSHTNRAHDWVKISAPVETEQHIKDGALFPYSKNVGLYLCPSDPRGYPRSYSLNNFLAGTGWGMTPITRITSIPNPARTMLMVGEADPRDWNRGSFVIGIKGGLHDGKWVDWPSSFHLDGVVHAFVDGHAENRRHEDPLTKEIVSFFTPAPNSPDLAYYQSVMHAW